ncbi:hypothetical protein CEXT_815901 [Caerostris extrusa]|uniref:Uncharacterized protein n=1 Tax=Caerostris extrusa TaxID=172846 RepID=A0AAV4T028_CAEEX|nr:hypothetical protein CEXT_815901 [Caerostris extrusa]
MLTSWDAWNANHLSIANSPNSRGLRSPGFCLQLSQRLSEAVSQSFSQSLRLSHSDFLVQQAIRRLGTLQKQIRGKQQTRVVLAEETFFPISVRLESASATYGSDDTNPVSWRSLDHHVLRDTTSRHVTPLPEEIIPPLRFVMMV